MGAKPAFRALRLLCLALLLASRLAIPAGWMPVRTDQGVAIMLCSGDGPVSAWIDAQGKVHKGEKKQNDGSAKDPCPYGALHAALRLAESPRLAGPPPAAAAAILPGPQQVAIGRGLAAPPPPATGPPLLS